MAYKGEEKPNFHIGILYRYIVARFSPLSHAHKVHSHSGLSRLTRVTSCPRRNLIAEFPIDDDFSLTTPPDCVYVGDRTVASSAADINVSRHAIRQYETFRVQRAKLDVFAYSFVRVALPRNFPIRQPLTVETMLVNGASQPTRFTLPSARSLSYGGLIL